MTSSQLLGRLKVEQMGHVNPARLLGPALILGGTALRQVWLFWLAPLLGAALAGGTYRWLTGSTGTEPVAVVAQRILPATTTIGDITTSTPAPQP